MRILVFLIIFHILYSCTTEREKGIINDYYGTQIVDNHRSLESIEDSTTTKYINDQNKFSAEILDNIPNIETLINKQDIYDKKSKYSIRKLTITNSKYIYYLKRLPEENIAKLYYKQGIDGKEIELYDPSQYNPESDNTYQINYFKPNKDESKIVIALNTNENEVSEIIIVDIQTKSIAPNIIKNCAPNTLNGVHWITNTSFLYSKLPNATVEDKNPFSETETNLYNINNYTSKVVFSKKHNPDIKIKSENFPLVEIINPKSKYAIGIVARASFYYDSYIKQLSDVNNLKINWRPLFKKERKIQKYDIVNDTIIYLTGEDTKNFKIASTSLINPDFNNPTLLVPEKENEVIKYIKQTNKGLFYTTVINGVQAKLYRLYKGKETLIPLPKASADIKLYKKGEELIIAIKGWLNKTERYKFNYDTNSFESYTIFPDRTLTTFDDLMVEELTVTAHDGEEIPLSLVYKKGTKLDGSVPVLMRGYGAYGSPMVPNAYYPFLLYAQEGGIYAVAHIRGGGEKGEAWYKGGYKQTKPNTWKDFISCTEYLIKNNYTSKGKIAIWAGSAGGILIGRSMTERPDLYAAAIIDRGMLNMVRIEAGVNGANSAKEFGSVKDSIEFRGLLAMDAYHHIKKNTKYPATLLRVGMNDTRVPPWQSFKFAAKLQDANSAKTPILLKTEFDSGHGLQFTKNSEFEMIADALAFAFWQTGHPDYQPKE